MNRDRDQLEGIASRDRLAELLVELVLEHGYAGTTVAMLCERAGVGEEAFHRVFPDLEHALIWAFERRAADYLRNLRAAHATEEKWPDNLRAVAYQAAWWVRENHRTMFFGNLVIAEVGELARAKRDEAIMSTVEFIDEGRQQLDDPDSMSRSTAESMTGAVAASLYRALETGEFDDPVSLVPGFMYMAVRPYLGHEVAARELEIEPPDRPPVPVEPKRPRRAPEN